MKKQTEDMIKKAIKESPYTFKDEDDFIQYLIRVNKAIDNFGK